MYDSSTWLLYAAALLFVLAPLAHILMRRGLRTYFPYFVATAGFLVFDLAGSVSANIVHAVPSRSFQLLLLANAVGLAALYPFLLVLASVRSRQGTLVALEQPPPSVEAGYRRYVWLLLGGSLGMAALFFVAFSPPVLLRVDLWGNMPALMRERTHIVFETPAFAWFALFMFEIPAFLAILVSIMRGLTAGTPAGPRWRRLFWVVVPAAMLLSVSYFHISILVNLIAALALVAFIYRGHVPLGTILKYALPIAVGIVLMYMGKQGFTLSLASLQDLGALVSHRLFEVYSWAAAVTAYLFPREEPFLHGASFINLFGLFNYQQVNLSTLVYPYIYNDSNGSAPVPAMFEGYANFGWPGALGTLAVMLAIVAGVTLLSWSRRPVSFAASVYLTVRLLLLWQVALWFGVLDPTQVFLFCVLGGARFVTAALSPAARPAYAG